MNNNDTNKEIQKIIYIAVQQSDVWNICASEGLGSGKSPLATYRIIGGTQRNHGTRTKTCDFNPSLDVMVGFDKIPSIKKDLLQQEELPTLSNHSPIVKADCFIRLRYNINPPIIKKNGLNIFLIHEYILFYDPQEITFLFENEKQLVSCKNTLQAYGIKNLTRYVFKTIHENDQIAINEKTWIQIKDKIQKKIKTYLKKPLSDENYQIESKNDMYLGTIAGYEIGEYIKSYLDKRSSYIKDINELFEKYCHAQPERISHSKDRSDITERQKIKLNQLARKSISEVENITSLTNSYRDMERSRKTLDQKLKEPKQLLESKRLLDLVNTIREIFPNDQWNWSDSDKQANMLLAIWSNHKFIDTDDKTKEMTSAIGKYLRNRNSNTPPTLDELNAYPQLQALFVTFISEGRPEKVIDVLKTNYNNAPWVLGVFCAFTGYAAINKALMNPQNYIATDIPETTNNNPH